MTMPTWKLTLKSNRKFAVTLTALSIVALLEQARAVEIEPKKKALLAVLGTPKVARKVLKEGGKDVEFYYSKSADGKPEKVAQVEEGVYEPNCTHTWVVGLDGKTGKVTEVRVVEMACPHAFPAKSASFLDQYKGKGPADVAKLQSEITTIAKATGTCRLTTDAVTRAITHYNQLKGQL